MTGCVAAGRYDFDESGGRTTSEEHEVVLLDRVSAAPTQARGK